MIQYLRATEIIDWQNPIVLERAHTLSAGFFDPVEIAKSCFEWVRDFILHSADHKASVTTCRASEVITEGTGFCFAKSHLLAALLRANGIPAGLCYQRLVREDGKGFTLHGFNAVLLPDLGWYRIDARGNKTGVDAQFCPPKEMLAFHPQAEEEHDFCEIWPDPVSIILDCLSNNQGWSEVMANLPDIAVRNKNHRTSCSI